MYSTKSNFSSRMKAMNVLTHSLAYEKPNNEIRKYLERIIKTAHSKLTKKIKDEEIDFDIYEIVTYMLNSDKSYLIDYLMHVDPDNLTDEHLSSFNSIIASVVSDLNDNS